MFSHYSPGRKGSPGMSGFEGPRGGPGLKGYSGVKGEIGLSGESGPKGGMGRNGEKGKTFHTMFGITCLICLVCYAEASM